MREEALMWFREGIRDCKTAELLFNAGFTTPLPFTPIKRQRKC